MSSNEGSAATKSETVLPEPVPKGWRIEPGRAERNSSAVRTEWRIRPPAPQPGAMTLTLTQSGSRLKADLVVPAHLIGWVNVTPTALPHQAVHLPDGVQTLEFSLHAESGGSGGSSNEGYGAESGTASSPPRSQPSWLGASSAGSGQEAGAGVDYRA
ncbi:MAG: hypothetical protein OWU84_05510 [Firmicutes bacterium]|nr:hypothetical protein [Bacillota bacterium]